jgi:hypothetical protein
MYYRLQAWGNLLKQTKIFQCYLIFCSAGKQASKNCPKIFPNCQNMSFKANQ